MQDVAHCVTLQMPKSKVEQVCRGRPTPFKGGLRGDKWWRYFKNRHPHLVLRTPKALDGKRAKIVTIKRCGTFYAIYKAFMLEYPIPLPMCGTVMKLAYQHQLRLVE